MSTLETPAEGEECPHFEQVDDTELKRLFSKVAAIRSQNYELFEFTHRPMEVFRTTAPGNPTWTEERIYRELTEDRLRNHAVVIEGEVGTGKSELCAYLSHKLRLDGRPIVHIKKNDDLMSILSERIPAFYEEQFGEELEGARKFQNLQEDMKSVPSTVANNATTGAILNLREEGYEVSPTPEEEQALIEFVAKKLETFITHGEYDQRVEFASVNEYKQREELQVFEEDVPTPESVEALNTELWAVIRDRYGTDSLDDVLDRVGSRFEDERPVIVFEDFSIAAMEAEKLRNYMERDIEGDNWDFILAGTRDATEVLHTQTAEDRFQFFQTNEADSNSVLFLDESSAVDFVRPYLGYIKSHDGSVRYDRDTEEGTFDLLAPEEGSLCAQCGFCDESFRDLFPFNQPFLRRIYSGLEDSEQSPREVIITVFEVLQQYYEGFVDAPSSVDILRPMRNPISVADSVYEEAEVFADLAKWYGVEENDHVVVSRKFVDAFGLSTEGLPETVTLEEEVVRVSATDTVTPPPPPPSDGCPNCGSEDRNPRDDGAVVCASCETVLEPPTRDPIQEKVDNAKNEVDAWLEDPDKYTQTDIYIRRAIRDLLEELTDGFRLYEAQPLKYNLSSQKEPFVYPDESAAPDDDQFVLDRREFNRSDLRSLVEFGVYRDEQPRSADYGKQLERLGSQLTGYAKRWRRAVAQSNLEDESVIYKRHAGYDFTDFVLSSYATLCVLEDPWKQITAERLNERYGSSDELSIDGSLRRALRDLLPADDFAHLDEAMDHASYIESLVGELLGVSASTLDVPQVRQRLADNPPYRILSMLGRAYVSNIDSRLRFDTGRTVKSFADTMYDVRQTLDDIADHGYGEEDVRYVVDVVAGTDLSEVADIHSNMRTYDHVDPDLLEGLGRLRSYDQSTLESVVNAATLAGKKSANDSWERIHASLISQKLSNTDLVTEFKAVPLNGGAGASGDSIGAAFKEVSSHYVD